MSKPTLLPLMRILKTEKLTIQYVVETILNPDLGLSPEDEDICITDILNFQPHISEEALIKYIDEYNEKIRERNRDQEQEQN
jgi:hypothetical protein